LQVPFVPQLAAPWSTQVPAGSAAPAGTLAQAPRAPGTLQAWHAAQLELAQHTPLTQLPLPHWALEPQVVPLPCLGPQTPPGPLQWLPALQFESVVQVVPHALEAPHT
jgi:hypothetical protein